MFRYFAWGPNPWPLAWCDIPTTRTLDCGVLACLAAELLTERGLRVDRVQLVERAAPEETTLWRARWRTAGYPHDWILSDHEVYHEALLVHVTPAPVLFDPTEASPVTRPLWMRRGERWETCL